MFYRLLDLSIKLNEPNVQSMVSCFATISDLTRPLRKQKFTGQQLKMQLLTNTKPLRKQKFTGQQLKMQLLTNTKLKGSFTLEFASC